MFNRDMMIIFTVKLLHYDMEIYFIAFTLPLLTATERKTDACYQFLMVLYM